MDEVTFERVDALVFFHMLSRAIRHEFVRKTIVNEVHLRCPVGKNVDHDIFELYVVVGSMRGVDDLKYVDKLLRYGEKLSQNGESTEILKVLLQVVAIFWNDVISTSYDFILSEVFENNYAMVQNLWNSKFVSGTFQFAPV